MKKSYSELLSLNNFFDRYRYLRCHSEIGVPTFGGSRHLNQELYACDEWKEFRNDIIIRDKGYELAFDSDDNFRINGVIIVHHLNPLTKEQVLNRDPIIFDPENVVCCSLRMHNAIHFGDESLLEQWKWEPRTPNDTIPWR